MNNLTIIIPVHDFNDVIFTYLKKAVESVLKQEDITNKPNILLVYSNNIESVLLETINNDEVLKSSLQLLKNEGKTDYQSQVNLASKNINTDYFSVLEFDDEYNTHFLKIAYEYINAYPEIDVFLTMMIEVNERGEGVKFANEVVWAQEFVGENGEIGYLNVDALKKYTDFKLSGAIIKTKEFIAVGGYKSNIKLTFMYEFLLRALNNMNKIYSIPKISYKHLMMRDGSLFDTFSKTMPMDERKFWFETATKESNFPNDRSIDTTRLKKIILEEK